ncbi:hypothetical protein IWQ51_006867 [Labrenzia sp. EL_142]|nr:hypothetical protein [Labrenzia sp. EL_142]
MALTPINVTGRSAPHSNECTVSSAKSFRTRSLSLEKQPDATYERMQLRGGGPKVGNGKKTIHADTTRNYLRRELKEIFPDEELGINKLTDADPMEDVDNSLLKAKRAPVAFVAYVKANSTRLAGKSILEVVQKFIEQEETDFEKLMEMKIKYWGQSKSLSNEEVAISKSLEKINLTTGVTVDGFVKFFKFKVASNKLKTLGDEVKSYIESFKRPQYNYYYDSDDGATDDQTSSG